ncbi:hypothetical protein DPX16_22569 [Anabarilius grahami]|uniref:Uncharacterized protein n=1 Tax=Anabarilius grahami TaxID=495550 RepID=A0A3N0XGT3_ANAGA|nr:hypothetical protein DPX16_22569 [Anabarilius grahami]
MSAHSKQTTTFREARTRSALKQRQDEARKVTERAARRCSSRDWSRDNAGSTQCTTVKCFESSQNTHRNYSHLLGMFFVAPSDPPPPPRFKNLEEEEHLFTCGTEMKTFSQSWSNLKSC